MVQARQHNSNTNQLYFESGHLDWPAPAGMADEFEKPKDMSVSDTPIPEDADQPFSWAVSDPYEPPELIQSLDSLIIALKALQMVADAGSAAAANVPRDATGEEVRQSWLASLMPLRYTVHHLQFRSFALIRSIGEMLEKD